MAAVAALVPDLLFGSNVVSLLGAGGHDVALVSDLGQLDPHAAEVLVVDLTADARQRLEQVQAANLADLLKIAVYAHVEADVRRLALDAGFDLVVPRSRFAREGGALVSRLLDAQR